MKMSNNDLLTVERNQQRIIRKTLPMNHLFIGRDNKLCKYDSIRKLIILYHLQRHKKNLASDQCRNSSKIPLLLVPSSCSPNAFL